MVSKVLISRVLCASALFAALFFAVPYSGFAHTIPDDIKVHAFVKPEGKKLLVLVRVPLNTGTDVLFPERPNGSLDLAQVDPILRGAAQLWLGENIDLYENGALLPNPKVDQTLVSIEGDPSFLSYSDALAHVTGPRLPNDAQIYWDQNYMDVELEYPIQSDRSSFAFHPRFSELAVRVTTDLTFVPPSGPVRKFEFIDDPGLLRFDPAWYQSCWKFFNMGFSHFLSSNDYLLILLCIVIPFRRLRGLLPIVIAFIAGQSITLIASAYHLAPDSLWFPAFIEALIAVSIAYVALENVIESTTVQRRRAAALCLGFVLGFSYSFTLNPSLQFTGSHELASIFSFDVGIVLSQLLVLALLILASELLFRRVVEQRMGIILVSGLVILTVWRSMLDRGELLMQYQFVWPRMTAATEASAMRWLMLILIVGCSAWALFGVLGSRSKGGTTTTGHETPKA